MDLKSFGGICGGRGGIRWLGLPAIKLARLGTKFEKVKRMALLIYINISNRFVQGRIAETPI